MIRIVIANQRGGSAKSTTTATLASCFADRGLRVLVIDADPQGSFAVILGISPPAFLNDLLMEKLAIRECVVSARPGLDIVCGNRFTTDAETKTMGLPRSEFLFCHMLFDCERNYDAVLIDVAPSISLFQTCAMVYTQNVLVPVDMDILSVQGATSTIHACETLNRMLEHGLNIRTLGMLPVKLNRRLAVTEMVLDTLASISDRREVPVYGPIRTDQSVVRAAADRQFIADYDPKSKALEDYEQLADALINRFGKVEAVPVNVKTA
jgi:chromosome partitioning protein